jgi:hypothetical protein
MTGMFGSDLMPCTPSSLGVQGAIITLTVRRALRITRFRIRCRLEAVFQLCRGCSSLKQSRRTAGREPANGSNEVRSLPPCKGGDEPGYLLAQVNV